MPHRDSFAPGRCQYGGPKGRKHAYDHRLPMRHTEVLQNEEHCKVSADTADHDTDAEPISVHGNTFKTVVSQPRWVGVNIGTRALWLCNFSHMPEIPEPSWVPFCCRRRASLRALSVLLECRVIGAERQEEGAAPVRASKSRGCSRAARCPAGNSQLGSCLGSPAVRWAGRWSRPCCECLPPTGHSLPSAPSAVAGEHQSARGS